MHVWRCLLTCRAWALTFALIRIRFPFTSLTGLQGVLLRAPTLAIGWLGTSTKMRTTLWRTNMMMLSLSVLKENHVTLERPCALVVSVVSTRVEALTRAMLIRAVLKKIHVETVTCT